MENKLTFEKGGIIHTPLNFFTMEDGKVVVIYQGSRGQSSLSSPFFIFNDIFIIKKKI